MSRTAIQLLSLIAVVACNQSDFGDDTTPPNPDGPGTPQWGETDVTCAASTDCNFGEACVAGVCQMKRCGQDAYDSVAPFGDKRTFVRDREIVVADGTASGGSYWARGYLPSGSSMSSASTSGSWSGGTMRTTDVAGGAFLDDGPELVAVAREGSATVFVPKLSQTISVGFVPAAIAAGDVDHDGRDEVVAVSATGQVSICDVELGSCERHDLGAGTIGLDVTVGDVDGDAIEEAVFHVEAMGQDRIVVLNLDAETTGQPTTVQVASNQFVAITAVDLDGDGRAEILGLEDGGWLGLFNDKVTSFSSNGAALAEGTTIEVVSNAIDIAGGDLDRDQKGELVLLTDDRIARVYRRPGSTLTLAYQATLSASSTPTKLTTVDFDGDSSVGRLVAGPELVPGEVVPTAVLYMPPYYESLSSSTSWRGRVMIGNSSTTTQARTDSVGLSIGATFGVSGEIPNVIEARIGVELNREATYSKTFASSITVANRYEVEADPTLYGNDVAAVVLTCGCFNAYTYELQSPVVGGHGERFVVLLPVGGESLVWSSKRYNAMAKALGTLPVIEVPSRVGDPRSYPTTPKRANGSPISSEDLVFARTPSVRVSDVADVYWNLDGGQAETNGAAMSTTVEVSGSVTMAGIEVGGSIGLGWTQGYEVEVGSTVELGGMVPAIADNPNTPEDEYDTYAYTFQPVVYREHYTKSDGSTTGYYVVNYSVAF